MSKVYSDKLAQALVFNNENEVLMVFQRVMRGDIVWNYPGGKIEEGETPEEACVREVKEETGYDVRIGKLLLLKENKYTFIAEIIGGQLTIDKDNPDNEDIINVEWVSSDDAQKWDSITLEIYDYYYKSR